MKRVLLTGASGFVGAAVLRELTRQGRDIAVLLRATSDTRRIRHLLDNVRVIRGDLSCLEDVGDQIALFKPEGVVHLAWEGVNGADRNSQLQLMNVVNAIAIYRLTERIGCGRFVGVGSQAEYGPQLGKIDESAATQPTTTYGAAKLATSLLLERTALASGRSFAWLRLFSSYGPGDDPSWLIPYIIGQLLAGRRPSLTAAEQVWDYIHVDDVARATVAMLDSEACGIFNLGSGQPHSLREVVTLIRDLIDPSLPLGFGEMPYRFDQVMHLEADITALVNATAWSPSISLRDGLRDLIAEHQRQAMGYAESSNGAQRVLTTSEREARSLERTAPRAQPQPETREDMNLHEPLRFCRLCGSASIAPAFHMRGMPKWNHRLLSESEVKSDRGIDLVMMSCGQCGFVMLPIQPADGYYDDYINAPSFSAQMREAQRQQSAAFVARFGLVGKGVLEIGCGDGSYLEYLSRAGAKAQGIEPSAAQRSLAETRGLRVDEGYLSGGRQLDGAPFDAFVTRQVLEHVSDIGSFLLGIRANLARRAVGLVEVPNFEKLLEDGRYFDFIPEHVNYFTPSTLRLALELAGFDVLETASAIDDEALCALVRLPPPADFEPARVSLELLAGQVATFLSESKRYGGEVAIWGAGGKGLSILASADLRDVDHLLDGDLHKWGRFTPVSHLKVSSPDILHARDIRAIVITAPAYQREIRLILEEKYRFRGRIALLENGLRVVQEPAQP